jgi:hypothetical protein
VQGGGPSSAANPLDEAHMRCVEFDSLERAPLDEAGLDLLFAADA